MTWDFRSAVDNPNCRTVGGRGGNFYRGPIEQNVPNFESYFAISGPKKCEISLNFGSSVGVQR
jgi:hypothetical protein